jgi:hypothetical protein
VFFHPGNRFMCYQERELPWQVFHIPL